MRCALDSEGTGEGNTNCKKHLLAVCLRKVRRMQQEESSSIHPASVSRTVVREAVFPEQDKTRRLHSSKQIRQHHP